MGLIVTETERCCAGSKDKLTTGSDVGKGRV